ncbi:MFS transporter [Hallella multisaccharivorax DSM 17128]|uniref:Major facilitator superfamily MFS_1 n=1 Tax=Hallella multisaccharivorax DSM 17128 TaxID=688246 RepID=F8NBQ9_9BACT|nr:MFS transporter [Hallella multisaccharivorax]EGN55935.1 major facilitator superfamily MFS_1 [Hallella multisaccharivorax DSM 17128]GJG29429.1 MFS transporter [Hallella multisaccharivorax DSM 17128]
MNKKKIYPWVVVALLWVVALLNYMDRQMLSTMQEAMKADIVELNKAEAFGALMAVFLWIYGLVSPLAGVFADRFSKKWLVVISLFVWSGVTFLMGFATSFSQLYVLRAVMGISEAIYIPSALTLIADWHTGKSRSLAIGIHMTGLYTGQAIGGFGATVAAAFSWEETFHGFGLIGIVYSMILILFLRDNPERELEKKATPSTDKGKRQGLRGMGIVLSTWAFWVLLFYFTAPSLPGWAVRNWLPTLFAQDLQIPMASAGPVSTITIAVSSFLGVIIGGVLSDRWVQRNIRGRIYTSAIGLALTIPALVFLGFGHSLTAVVGAGVCFGVGYGMFDANNMPILCQIISVRYRATAYGLMNMTGVFAGALVTQVLGRWSDGGELGLGFALLGGIVALAVILQLACLRPITDNVE